MLPRIPVRLTELLIVGRHTTAYNEQLLAAVRATRGMSQDDEWEWHVSHWRLRYGDESVCGLGQLVNRWDAVGFWKRCHEAEGNAAVAARYAAEMT